MFKSMLFAVMVLMSAPSWAAEKASLLDGAVHINLPQGFSQLKPDEISSRFGRGKGRPPLAAFGDEKRKAMIVFTLSQPKTPFKEGELDDFVKNSKQSFQERLSGVTWHKDEMTINGGRKWGRMLYSVKNQNTDAKNDMYVTEFRGGVFVVNMTAPESVWNASQTAFMESFRSIRVKN